MGNYSPLFVAAMKGHAAVCKFLLEKGCDVNEVVGTESSCLYTAAYNGQLETMKVLIEAGGNINFKV